jgi:hypothetical protein
MPTKLDLKKTLKHLYNPPTKDFTVIEVPPLNFLMLDGQGDPNTAPAYKEAVEALYAVAYTLKFAVKKAQGIDYPVMALEGLWWVENMAEFSVDRKGDWLWTMLIMQPEPVTAALVVEAVEQVRKKKNPPALPRLRFERYDEGLSVQIMHIGPYAAEAPTLARLHHEYIPAHGYETAGKHHEIYLGDPRRSAPEKLKTVLRQPVRVRISKES